MQRPKALKRITDALRLAPMTEYSLATCLCLSLKCVHQRLYELRAMQEVEPVESLPAPLWRLRGAA